MPKLSNTSQLKSTGLLEAALEFVRGGDVRSFSAVADSRAGGLPPFFRGELTPAEDNVDREFSHRH